MNPLNRLDVRTWIEINQRSLFFNVRQFQKKARPAELMAVVKSNAYGHGLSLIARLLVKANPKSEIRNSKLLWMGVDSIVEAMRLRRDGIKNPILVLGYTLPSRFKDAARGKIVITISHFEGLRELARSRIKPEFHLKLDTGMHRHGFQEHDLLKLEGFLVQNRLFPSGVFSHLAAADNKRYSEKQMASFDRMLALLARAGIKPRVIHFNKTEGILYYKRSDILMRLGIGLYGYIPTPRKAMRTHTTSLKTQVFKDVVVKPVLTWKTVVSEVKQVKKGEHIGYDLTYRFSRDATIAILPIGYWHGYDRGLSNVGEVLIRGKRAPVRGRVCMDITVVEVTKISNVKIGDEVILIGRQMSEFISADEIAKKIGTTSYEVLTRINPLIKRIPA